MTLLAYVTNQLRREQIEFALIGAAALAAHGVSRSTVDIDLLVVDPRVLSLTSTEPNVIVEVPAVDALVHELPQGAQALWERLRSAT